MERQSKLPEFQTALEMIREQEKEIVKVYTSANGKIIRGQVAQLINILDSQYSRERPASVEVLAEEILGKSDQAARNHIQTLFYRARQQMDGDTKKITPIWHGNVRTIGTKIQYFIKDNPIQPAVEQVITKDEKIVLNAIIPELASHTRLWSERIIKDVSSLNWDVSGGSIVFRGDLISSGFIEGQFRSGLQKLIRQSEDASVKELWDDETKKLWESLQTAMNGHGAKHPIDMISKVKKLIGSAERDFRHST